MVTTTTTVIIGHPSTAPPATVVPFGSRCSRCRRSRCGRRGSRSILRPVYATRPWQCGDHTVAAGCDDDDGGDDGNDATDAIRTPTDTDDGGVSDGNGEWQPAIIIDLSEEEDEMRQYIPYIYIYIYIRFVDIQKGGIVSKY